MNRACARVGCAFECCSQCAANNGYLPDDRFAVASSLYEFDATVGFSSEQGCRIPRKDRSATCLTYLCDRAVRELGVLPKDGAAYFRITSDIHWIYHLNGF